MIPKFRVWDKYTDTMFDVKVINYHLKAVYGLNKEYIEYNQKTFPFKDYPIMQSTGMFDKNGKEIYEGDVVETERIKVIYASDDKCCELNINFKGVVKRINGCFVIKSNEEEIYLYSGINGIKIIGHKYMEEYKEFLNE